MNNLWSIQPILTYRRAINVHVDWQIEYTLEIPLNALQWGLKAQPEHVVEHVAVRVIQFQLDICHIAHEVEHQQHRIHLLAVAHRFHQPIDIL